MHENKPDRRLGQGLLPLTYEEAQSTGHLQVTAIRLGGGVPSPCQGMGLASSHNVVGEESTSEWAVDGSPHTVLIGVVYYPTKVPIYFEPSGPGHTRGGIQESIGHIDHVKHVGIQELSDLVSVVAPANETDVPGFAIP